MLISHFHLVYNINHFILAIHLQPIKLYQMNEKKLNGQESIELIAQMIQSTKQTTQVGNGNVFLYYGYCAAILSIFSYAIIPLTGNPLWYNIWFLMFVPNILMSIKQKKDIDPVITYTDLAINNVWKIIGALFIITAIVILTLFAIYSFSSFALMLPLALIYSGIGVAITGVILRERWLVISPILSIVIAIYMLFFMTTTRNFIPNDWNLLFGISLFFSMVISGHILNYKSRRNV